jgi:hypothetical protein
MTYNDDFFTPEHVDEQIDELSQRSPRDYLPPHEQTSFHAQAETRLIADLEACYQPARQEDRASLAHAWARISALAERQYSPSQPTQPLPVPVPAASQERILVRHGLKRRDPARVREGKFARRLSLLVAVCVSVFLVGGLVVMTNLSRQQSATSVHVEPAKKPPIPTRTPPVFGKTLYTTAAYQSGFESLSWSPDSKRVASATVDHVQFWDATTGAHLITVQLPDGSPSEWAWSLDWSPNSDNVAVATNKHLLIVNGQVMRREPGSLTLITLALLAL